MKTFFVALFVFIFLTLGFVIFWSNKNDKPIGYPAAEILMSLKKKPHALQYCTYLDDQTKTTTLGLVVEDTSGVLNVIDFNKVFRNDSSDSAEANYVNIDSIFGNLSKVNRLVQKRLKNYSGDLEKKELENIQFLTLFPQPRKIRVCVVSKGHQRNIRRKELKTQNSVLAYAAFYVPLNWITKDNVFAEAESTKSIDYHYSDHLGLHSSKQEIAVNGSSSFDVEPELAIIISKNGKNINKDEVKDYIAGYSLFNDFTDRAFFEKDKMTFFDFIKSKAANAMGPFFVTDLDPDKVAVEVYINDDKIITCSNEGLSLKIDEIISELSNKDEGIFAGEVISIGAMNGGSLYELDLPLLKAGDKIKIVGNQGLGILENTLID